MGPQEQDLREVQEHPQDRNVVAAIDESWPKGRHVTIGEHWVKVWGEGCEVGTVVENLRNRRVRLRYAVPFTECSFIGGGKVREPGV